MIVVVVVVVVVGVVLVVEVCLVLLLIVIVLVVVAVVVVVGAAPCFRLVGSYVFRIIDGIILGERFMFYCFLQYLMTTPCHAMTNERAVEARVPVLGRP